MVGCCAKHCKNRSENGFRMFRFPKDMQRKQVWLEKCGKSIAPTSRLCERHFDDSQFENHREDKWRKLKQNAVPTIFNDENSTITFNNQLAVGQQTPHENLFENDYVQDFNPVILTNFNSNIRDNENVIDGNSLNEHFPSAKMVTDTSIQTDGDSDTLMLQAKYISNEEGTIRQANEIKYLQLQLEKERAKANMLKSKYDNEKLLRLKMTTKMKSYKKKCCTLSEKLEKIPFFKKFAAGLSNPHQPKWSPECLKLATQIRYAVGWKAYLYLKKDLQLPLPAYSTLCNHISKLDFSPGLLKDVLSLMAKKKKIHSSTHQSDSVILMDEMDIKKSLEYDVSTGSFIGQTTCEEGAKLSTTVVVFMLRGLTENWKQIISWHLTSKSSDDCVMTQLLLEIVEEIEKIGFRVHGLVCDMGPKNQAIWRNLGVNVSRDNVVPFIDHPVRTGNSFYIFPDVPHLLKNLRMALTNNSIIIIARSIVESENLRCNEVRFKYLEELVAIQERHSDLKLAPNITAEILRPSSFNKMQVSPAAHIFNVRTAVALETLIELKMIDKEAETTAWFIKKVRAWFDVMNSRYQSEAINLSNKNVKIAVIDNFLDLMENIIIGKSWKPVQTGIKMSVLNTITLVNLLFKTGYNFFLTSRLNQDAIENLFSTLRRHGNGNPTALETKRCLRLITLCQFLDTRKTKKNYEDDNDEHYVQFFLSKEPKKGKDLIVIPPEDCMYSPVYENTQNYTYVTPITNRLECNIINNVLGSAISYVLRKKYACSDCLKYFTDDNGQYSLYTKTLSFGFLENPSNGIFNYISLVEGHLQAHFERCALHPRLFEHLLQMIEKWAPYKELAISNICAERTKPCNFFYNILRRYIHIRQIIFVNDQKKKIRLTKNKSFASKSAYRQSII